VSGSVECTAGRRPRPTHPGMGRQPVVVPGCGSGPGSRARPRVRRGRRARQLRTRRPGASHHAAGAVQAHREARGQRGHVVLAPTGWGRPDRPRGPLPTRRPGPASGRGCGGGQRTRAADQSAADRRLGSPAPSVHAGAELRHRAPGAGRRDEHAPQLAAGACRVAAARNRCRAGQRGRAPEAVAARADRRAGHHHAAGGAAEHAPPTGRAVRSDSGRPQPAPAVVADGTGQPRAAQLRPRVRAGHRSRTGQTPATSGWTPCSRASATIPTGSPSSARNGRCRRTQPCEWCQFGRHRTTPGTSSGRRLPRTRLWPRCAASCTRTASCPTRARPRCGCPLPFNCPAIAAGRLTDAFRARCHCYCCEGPPGRSRCAATLLPGHA